MNIYVGNLATEVDQNDLQNAFSVYGEVGTTKIILDHENGESRGFGFVDMPDKTKAETAIKKLDGTELKGQVIKVSEARQRRPYLRSSGVRGGKLTRGGGKRF